MTKPKFGSKVTMLMKPLIITQHDGWLLPGKLGFLYKCDGWTDKMMEQLANIFHWDF